MPDAAASSEGGRVLMVSSLDMEHPGDNVIDGSRRSCWLSTGLYPQEILLALAYPCLVSAVHLAAMHVRVVRIEGCPESAPVNFHALAERELCDERGVLQDQVLECAHHHACEKIEFLRIIILSGWHDFCSVHSVHVCAERAIPSSSRAVPGLLALNNTSGATADRNLARSGWLEQLEDDGLTLRFAHDWQADREVVLVAVAANGDALQFACKELQADREVVLCAVREKGTAIAWATEALRGDHQVALAAVQQNGNALQHVSAGMRADREVVLAAVRHKGSALRWATRELRCDKDVVATASENFYFT
eukprot:CAMPEP_0172916424 /NCGR_PEP_ID=MMETSP1075-20121228/196337_1 /TAXON_ID=2916 /ORGANISM="Ceratium fusus, Strain PA161109" /LENGTH=306 /DNA_ID=CAMNT_0013775719 /DNA_START=74 /DNA_END=991 /DNA_ORIENTATION=+